MAPYEQPAKTGGKVARGAHFDNCPEVCQFDHQEANNEFSHDLRISVRETFFAYNNRHSDDNRGAQHHLGPSEIGTPCDRRLAYSLLGVPPVNPGGDGFAAWLGTQGHRGMADIYEWSSGKSGRYAVETPLNFPSKHVPRGTGDLLDRSLRCFIDHKFMGTWSLKKLRAQGPSPTYRVQLHTYAYGAVQRGEKVDHVALIAWPRQGSSLDELYIWSEPYDRHLAIAALERVQVIADRVREDQANAVPREDSLQAINTAEDCNYCPHHLKGATDLSFACNGKH